MIKIKVNGSKPYEIPTAWSDLTYSQYVSLLTLPNSLVHQIHLFTQIPLETLQSAELKNLEKIAIALSFINLSPKAEEGPKDIGKYFVPKDVTIESLGQFEDLRALIHRRPTDLSTIENNLLWCDLCLEACSIYVQKLKDGKYDSSKVSGVKEELKSYPAMPIIQTGSFFFGKLLSTLTGTTNRYRSLSQRLKKWLLAFPGYRKSLDFLLHSSEFREK
jgi:hypothetical protein